MTNLNNDFIKDFHAKRCGEINIENEQQYETLLYKTLVLNLTIFDGDNWGNFEFSEWIAAIHLYEFNNSLPYQYANLRQQLENKHEGFYIEQENFGDSLEQDGNNQPTEQTIDSKYDLIFNEDDYLYHLHKSIEVKFHGTKEDKQKYNYAKYWQAVKYYEQQHQLPNQSTQFFMDERFREMHLFRSKLLRQSAS